MPNQTPTWVVDELLAEAVVRPTLGAPRYAERLAERGFGSVAAARRSCLYRHGLGRRRQRVAALAQLTGATSGLVTEAAFEGPFGFCHFAARPGDLVALDSFYIGKLKGVGPVWQLTAVDTATRWAVVEVFIGPSNTEIANRFLDRVIRKLGELGITVSGVLSDNGPEFGPRFRDRLAELEIVHHRTPPRSPNHNAVCERFQGTLSKSAGVPRSTDDVSTGSPNSKPSSIRGSSPTTPDGPITATSCAGEPHAKSSTLTAKSEHHEPHRRAHLSPRPVARKA